MSGSPGGAGGLRERAAATRVVVIGGGVAGLVAALECAKVGLTVTVLEGGATPGGAVRRADVGGLALDVGAESYATRGGHARALIDELGIGDRVVAPAGGRAWLAGVPGVGAAPMPAGGVLGIPENPFAPDVRRVIGWPGAWRAYVDRLRPVLTIGHEHSLATLVRSRMGARVLDRLVAPVVQGVYSARPDDIDVDTAAPGLNAALTQAGSLSGAVAALRGGKPAAAPGAAVNGLQGGMSTLVDALVRRLGELDVELRTNSEAVAIERAEGGWRVDVAETTVRDAEAPAADSLGSEPSSLFADVVVVAVPEDAARRLLAPVVPELPAAGERPAPVVEVVTLVVDAPALDDAPRGSGVLCVPGTHTAKALTHVTAKWPWVAAAAGAGRHVVRVSFGAQGEAPATAALDEDGAARLALAEASALLGVDLPASVLVAARRERYEQSQPASVIGQADAAARARAAVGEQEGLGVVGAWIAGTGLAQVIPDAIAEADRLRHGALWA